jgi:hypothetical protein
MRERLRLTALAPMRTIITVRRQNMSTIPAIAASAEATGIKVSGPMYIFELLAVEGGRAQRWRHPRRDSLLQV